MKDWLIDAAHCVGVGLWLVFIIVAALIAFLLLSAGIALGLEWTAHLIQGLRP